MKKMKTRFIIDENNINLFHPYQGNDQKLEIGDSLQISDVRLPCVIRQKGMKGTFSIYCGKVLKRYTDNGIDNLSAYTFMRNRFSINDKYTK